MHYALWHNHIKAAFLDNWEVYKKLFSGFVSINLGIHQPTKAWYSGFVLFDQYNGKLLYISSNTFILIIDLILTFMLNKSGQGRKSPYELKLNASIAIFQTEAVCIVKQCN